MNYIKQHFTRFCITEAKYYWSVYWKGIYKGANLPAIYSVESPRNLSFKFL